MTQGPAEAGTEGGRERGPGRRRPQCLRTCDLARPRWRRRHSLSAASGAPASGSGWPVPSGRPGGGTAAGPGSESEITSHACSAAPAAKPSEPVTGSEPRRAPEAAGRARAPTALDSERPDGRVTPAVGPQAARSELVTDSEPVTRRDRGSGSAAAGRGRAAGGPDRLPWQHCDSLRLVLRRRPQVPGRRSLPPAALPWPPGQGPSLPGLDLDS